MSVKKKHSQDEMNILLKAYLETTIRDAYPELEVRFGTRGFKSISRIDYENVIKKLLSSGFVNVGGEKYKMNIQNEHINIKSGKTIISTVRTEIEGLLNIQNYCKANSLDDIDDMSLQFVLKKYYKDPRTEHIIYPINFDDWSFRVAFQVETNLQKNTPIVDNLLEKWKDSKKVFRLINRVSYMHPTLPIKVDLSIVKNSNKRGKYMIPEYNIENSGVFENPEKYEIEIEFLREKVGIGTPYESPSSLHKVIKQTSKTILSGLQETNYPVSYIEQSQILDEYLHMIQGKAYKEKQRVYSSNFIGPSSYTLQIANIAPINEDAAIPNIRKDYTVTDKADGMRKMMYISKKGKIYLIDTNMNVQFTGAIIKEEKLFNSLLDGEHILHNKEKKFINLYAAFDIYFIHGVDLRSAAFLPYKDVPDHDKEEIFRLQKLVNFIQMLEPESIVAGNLTPIRIENKKFYNTSDTKSIFQGCNLILKQINEGLYEYETDGLIFTPMNMGVGSNRVGEPAKNYKITWDYSFKWKPAEFNTIDFLITTKKTPQGQEYIGNIFQDGKDTSSVVQLTQYKTLILRVGFDERKHGYINPCGDIINNKLPSPEDLDNKETYKPMPFYPTNPYDPEANICNIILKEDATNKKQIFTEEDEVIEDNMIVEFKYKVDKEKQWRWIPLRVRYDKTAEYRSGRKNFGNAYHVANSNWHSIHNPITREMLRTGENIPDELGDDDIYYNKISGSTQTRALRDFHNLFVKKILLKSISRRGNTLIDFAVGKGGDLPKWISAKLSFVFGIDIAKDNIENRLDGVCSRYLNYRKQFKVMPYGLFLHGDSSVNIRDTNALYTEKAKQITKAIFGEGPKDETLLGKGIYHHYGKGNEGFNISSIQFALHYMFESSTTLQNFLRNVSECTKVGGYFTATCYDGKTLFNKLKTKSQGESITIMSNEKKLWSITKQYNRDEFTADSSCLGYPIDVYQESINKTFQEYLVNFDYLTRLMENYGFRLLTRDESHAIGLPSSSGMFNELFGLMSDEITRNKRKKTEYGQAIDMTSDEKYISFLNRYYIYKKVRDVNAEKISLALMNKTKEEELAELMSAKKVEKIVEEVIQEDKKKKPIKKKKKLVLKSIESKNKP